MDELLDAALGLPEREREPFVERAAAGDEALRDEVLSLLRAQSRAAGFMEQSALRVAARALAREAAPEPLAGREVGGYVVERLLGAGGMGEVYLARELKLGRPVAFKVLPRHALADPERAERFKREARALSALNHPNLVTVYDVGEHAGLAYIAMEYVEGRTLRSLLEDRPRLGESLAIAAQIAEALAAAHHAGVVHRDVKPDNVMVRRDGYVKLLDFGLAKLTEPSAPRGDGPGVTRAGAAMGTLAYMSPEQAAGEAVDHRTDIWSLGVLIYELVAGRKPFGGADRRATVNAIMSSEPAPASDSNPALPAELDAVLDKALEKDRELRYQTAADLRADLRRVLRAVDSSAVSGRGRAGAGRARRAGRARWLLAGAALAALALVALGAWWWAWPREDVADWSRATHAQLTDQPGTEFFPALAPDGNSFVYASRAGGRWKLFLQRVGGKNATPLTAGTPSDEVEPAFSPAGDRIAFRSSRGPVGIYVMEATGENPRLVVAEGHHPSWSPDGKELVYSIYGQDAPYTRASTPSSLWVVSLETGAQRLLTRADAVQPSWSPGGHRIAFWFYPPNVGRSVVATIARDGGEPVVVTQDASTNWNPVWSPDGKFLYFASDRSGNTGFWRVPVEEETGRVLGEPEAVSTPSAYSRHLSFSRDGRRLLYVQTVQRSNIRAVGFDPRAEKVVGEPFWVTRGDRQVSRPELSPDGTRFVLRVARRSQDDLAVVNLDGTNWRDLTNDESFDRYPRWSPDGRRIAFASDRGGSYEIWTLDAEGANFRRLTSGSERGASFPLWSPDGRQILFQRNNLNAFVDADKDWTQQTSRPLSAAEGPANFVAWDWSPDGGKLAVTFVGPWRGVGYFSLAGGGVERLTEAGSYPMWLSDSRRLVYTADRKAYVADVVTKRVREVFDAGDEELRSAGVSKDGRLLYFTLVESESNIWLLDLRQ